MKKIMKLIKVFLIDQINRYKLIRQRKYVIKNEGAKMRLHKINKLTKEEKQHLKEQWGGMGLKVYYDFYKMYKTFDKFDSQYLSHDLLYPHMIKILNPPTYSYALCHKGNYDTTFPVANQPHTLIKCINGIYFNGSREIITKEDAITFLTDKAPFIIKPTIDTSSGHNIYKISDFKVDDMMSIINTIGDNFIIQKILEQSQQTAIYNPDSLNTIRVTTLFINGRFSVCNICMKIGRKGSVVDNMGSGGLMVGIHNNGALFDYAYDMSFNKHYEIDGIAFTGKKIDAITGVIELAKKLHTHYIPNMCFVGWDIAISKDNQPVLIEANLKYPSIMFQQICTSSSIFGDRTNEVIEYIKKHNN